jgi:cbb3-type cytochrome oxidase subunit 3
MRTKIIKIIVIFFLVMIPITFFAFMKDENQANSKMPMFITIGIMAACGAVWKYQPEEKKENNSSDNQELDKTNN